ncbi:hypothetical protein PO148_06555 [Limosilactobacillus mucosae]|uniref:Uncharacterized protein n=1 Tax=Limosilactobacillus mucosae TaxID=97478 RepID=A0AAJ1HUW0_LIMMU|nr:hypothetical protein [Limosilactobacillus mucosae]MDC2830135.1 hypothetical protein [Limosilactobacillus mucosae]MDC2837593.1 hypothetical protein [Limosilactobacillus mucosae]MDC2849635.1 hypothetical protein [Limosilactobacillus mucosae]MDC2853860.1 hypothetical protein [Limosilactobacillus mucosae]
MLRRHSILFFQLAILLVIIASLVLIVWSSLYQTNMMIAIAIMIVLGVLVGMMVPSILIGWLIIALTTLGSAILLLGYVVVAAPIKLALLFTFPVIASVTLVAREMITGWGWLDKNRSEIQSYAAHYDPVTKLLTRYNAVKLYEKCMVYIHDREEVNLWTNITAIHWTHSTQFQQFHEQEYNQMLQEIARVLKVDRLPSEMLYYLGNATFMIISHELSDKVLKQLNDQTKNLLGAIEINGAPAQYKWGTQKIDRKNVEHFMNFEKIDRHLQREMETDIVTEYLKGNMIDG